MIAISRCFPKANFILGHPVQYYQNLINAKLRPGSCPDCLQITSDYSTYLLSVSQGSSSNFDYGIQPQLLKPTELINPATHIFELIDPKDLLTLDFRSRGSSVLVNSKYHIQNKY